MSRTDRTPLRVRLSLRNLALDGDVLNVLLYLADHAVRLMETCLRADAADEPPHGWRRSIRKAKRHACRNNGHGWGSGTENRRSRFAATSTVSVIRRGYYVIRSFRDKGDGGKWLRPLCTDPFVAWRLSLCQSWQPRYGPLDDPDVIPLVEGPRAAIDLDRDGLMAMRALAARDAD